MKHFKCKTCRKLVDYIYNNYKYNWYYKDGKELKEYKGECYKCYYNHKGIIK